MATDVPAYTEETWVEGAAPGIAAAQLQRLDDQIKALTDEFNIHNGGATATDHGVSTPSIPGFHSAFDKNAWDAHEGGTSIGHHPVATPSVRGFMSETDKAKLNGIQAGAKDDPTATEILNALSSVDGDGSGLDADVLDGIQLVSLMPSIFLMTSRVETATVAIGTGLQLHHDFTYIKPSGWGTYDLMVIAHALYDNGSAASTITANLDLSGSNSPTTPGHVKSSTMHATLVCAHKIGASGNVAVKMETIRAGGTQTDATATAYQMFAMRLT